jgi:DNA-nicking Smr family endonuclease
MSQKDQPHEIRPPDNEPGLEGPPVPLPIEDSLDLHPFAPRDVPSVVGEYLDACVRRGLSEVRVIHGRGTGSQRARVRQVLAAHPAVAAFADAPPERGGWGATVVVLRVE